MTQETVTGQVNDSGSHRGRGPTRPFPVMPLGDALQLPRSILQYSIDGKIQRLTLSSKLEQSNEGKLTRNLITNSYKYGLTRGSYASPALEVTDDGRVALASDNSLQKTKEKLFELAISRFDLFDKLYEKLKDKPLRDETVIKDEFKELGVNVDDCQDAAEVFISNVKFLGLVERIGGRDHVRSVEHIIAQFPSTDTVDSVAPVGEMPTGEVPAAEIPRLDVPVTAPLSRNVAQGGVEANTPSVHIDIQIHIDSTATADQIDQIFASMAHHLYGREG